MRWPERTLLPTFGAEARRHPDDSSDHRMERHRRVGDNRGSGRLSRQLRLSGRRASQLSSAPRRRLSRDRLSRRRGAGAGPGARARREEPRGVDSADRDQFRGSAAFAQSGLRRFRRDFATDSGAAGPGALALEEPASQRPPGRPHQRRHRAGPTPLRHRAAPRRCADDPKRPGFVLVTGQVYNATALTFTPGKTAGWYLRHAGGTNGTANRKEIFVIRANGSVIGRHSGGWFDANVLSTRLDPGDVVVVPQKVIGALSSGEIC
jgi:hypothetical protein